MDERLYADKFVRISKKLSYALRHNPGKFGFSLDEKGFAPIADVVGGLYISLKDIRTLVQESEKKRFEIVGDKIRALYGHSIQVDLGLEPVEPPPVLYHGTSLGLKEEILAQGLKPMGRQFVHLSVDVASAMAVGRRHDPRPSVLKIDAKVMYEKGFVFYETPELFLTTEVPAEFIEGDIN